MESKNIPTDREKHHLTRLVVRVIRWMNNKWAKNNKKASTKEAFLLFIYLLNVMLEGTGHRWRIRHRCLNVYD